MNDNFADILHASYSTPTTFDSSTGVLAAIEAHIRSAVGDESASLALADYLRDNAAHIGNHIANNIPHPDAPEPDPVP